MGLFIYGTKNSTIQKILIRKLPVLAQKLRVEGIYEEHCTCAEKVSHLHLLCQYVEVAVLIHWILDLGQDACFGEDSECSYLARDWSE